MGGAQLQLRRFDAVALAREVSAPLASSLESRRQALDLDAPACQFGSMATIEDWTSSEQSLIECAQVFTNRQHDSPRGSR